MDIQEKQMVLAFAEFEDAGMKSTTYNKVVSKQEKKMINVDEAFKKACKENNLQEVKKILKSEDKILLNGETYNDGFITACNVASIDVAQYLYDFSTPSEFALKESFRGACDMQNIESIRFLVLETSLMRKDVKEYIAEVKGYSDDLYQEIQLVFKEKYNVDNGVTH